MFRLFAFFEQVINKEHPTHQSKTFTAVLGFFALQCSCNSPTPKCQRGRCRDNLCGISGVLANPKQ